MKGLTLLEVLVAIGIFSFIVLGIFTVLGSGGTHYATNLVSLNLQRQARQGMSWLVRDVRQAYLSKITDKDNPEPRESITFDIPKESGVTYSVVSGQLWRKYPTGEVKANDIKSLEFPPIEGNLQTITLTAEKTYRSFDKDRTLTFSLTEQVKVRNR